MRYSDEKDKLKDDILGVFHGMILGAMFSGLFILAMIF